VTFEGDAAAASRHPHNGSKSAGAQLQLSSGSSNTTPIDQVF